MRALVVFESIFGNTRAVAEAIGAGLSAVMPADVREVSAAPDQIGDDVTLLVVGGPTHAFGMSRPGTRQDAARQAAAPVPGGGIREWLEKVPASRRDVSAVTFDTRIRKPPVPGSAARAAARHLRRRGLHVLGHGESFWVTGTQGPLLEGEEERARRWGAALASQVTGQPAAS